MIDDHEGKKIVIIAGPNGAGKTTFAREFLPNEAGCQVFVNADLIAAGLSPFFPERAAIQSGRLMLGQIKMHVKKNENFAFETTLSGRGYSRMIPKWRGCGYRIKIIFLKLPSVEIAVARVAARVAQGGHNIPEPIIRRRFILGWKNFTDLYSPIVDTWQVFDNAGDTPKLLEER